jgi:amidase
MSDTFAGLDAIAQADLVKRREIAPDELVRAAIARTERLDERLQAVILPAFERAAKQAAGANGQQAADTAPFRGVPFLMKDLGGQEAGAPCHMGMKALKEAGWVERADSYLAARLREGGFVSLGRTNTPELGLLPTTEPLAYGPTRNPWNQEYSAGGSSGGSAAAVAAGLVPAAHASDGGGSIRIPAAHCGLVGLKPTRGRSSFGPSIGERWAGFSCEFVVTRSVRDAAAILDVTAGPMPGDPYFAPPPLRAFIAEAGASAGKLKVGVLTTAPRADMPVHSDCVAAATRATLALEAMGHVVEDAHPEALHDPEATRAFVTIVACNTARALDAVADKLGRPVTPEDVEPLTWALAELGRACAAPQYIATVEFVHGFGRRVTAWWEQGFDLLVTPTAAQPPPRIGELVPQSEEPLVAYAKSAPFGAFTSAFNLTGQPAISLPLHWTPEGLPVGVQLVAAYGREDLLLRVAAQLEQSCPWADRRPPVFGC